MKLCLVHVHLPGEIEPNMESRITIGMYVMSFCKTHYPDKSPLAPAEWLPAWLYEGETTDDAAQTAVRVCETLYAETRRELTVLTLREGECGVACTPGLVPEVGRLEQRAGRSPCHARAKLAPRKAGAGLDTKCD